MKRYLTIFFCACSLVWVNSLLANNELADERLVVANYADIALAVYEDSLSEAIILRREVRRLITKPSAEQLTRARDAWRRARIPYAQSEVFRFGNVLVDDWEGKVNAWPLDEGLIDYIIETPNVVDNAFAAANVIANPEINDANFSFNATKLTPEVVEGLHMFGDIESNVATGYHAIEFLLWGQDTHGVQAGAGERPHTDFDRKQCSNGHCFRRAKYLRSVTDLLVKDLTWMVKQWEHDIGEKYAYINGADRAVFDVGLARQALLEVHPLQAIASMLTGMGGLAYGELAGERTKLALLVSDPEEEQDCFSDNTHYAHYYNVLGIENVFHGKYRRVDGRIVEGPSVASLLKQSRAKTHQLVVDSFAHARKSAQAIVNSAEQEKVARTPITSLGFSIPLWSRDRSVFTTGYTGRPYRIGL